MKRYLVIEFIKGFSGGLGDRFVGLVTAIQIAKVCNRTLLIKWDTSDLRKHVDYANYDYDNFQLPINSEKITINAIDNQAKLQHYFSQTNLELLNQYDIITLQCNCNLGQYLYINPYLKLDSSTYSKDIKQIYQTIYTDYLKPNKMIIEKIDEYLQKFQIIHSTDKSIVGLQIRTGDKLFEANGVEIVPTKDLEQIVYYFKDILETQLLLNKYTSAIFLCYDNSIVEKIIKKIFYEYEIIFYVAPIIHIDKLDNQLSTNDDGFRKIIIDQILLSKTDYLLISNSNLARTAYLMSSVKDGYCLRYYKEKNQYQVYRLTSEYASSKAMEINIWSDAKPVNIYTL